MCAKSSNRRIRRTLLKDKVYDIELSRITTISDLVSQMYDSGGFTAKQVGIAANIIERIFKDKRCVKFLSFPACIVATGTRGIIKTLVEKRLVDIIITTCGTIDHDFARSWKNYYHGDFLLDDEKLHQLGINRLGNIIIPNDAYGIIIERKVQPILRALWDEGKRELSTKELVWELGQRIKDDNSILYWCAKNRIPMYIPGIIDGAVGSQLWLFMQEHREFKIDLFKDQQELAEYVFNAERTGALLIGGGISKHHTIWWNQFRDGLDYGVYITTAQEFDGSLSGAELREAVSWGKMRADAKYVTVHGDATVLLPLLIATVLARLQK
jgi:deoxyhypusine synthase